MRDRIESGRLKADLKLAVKNGPVLDVGGARFHEAQLFSDDAKLWTLDMRGSGNVG